MNLLVIIDSTNQDQFLGIEINRIMKDLSWITVKGFPFVFTKEVDNEDVDDLTSGIQEDIDAAAFQAELKDVKYLYKIGGSEPVTVGTK
jgi:hypothetical protein